MAAVWQWDFMYNNVRFNSDLGHWYMTDDVKIVADLQRVTNDPTIPGRSGVAPAIREPYQPSLVSVKLRFRPANGKTAFEAYQALLGWCSAQGALGTAGRRMHSTTWAYADAKFVSSTDYTRVLDDEGESVFVFSLPNVYFRDGNVTTYSYAPSQFSGAVVLNIDTMTGSRGAIEDGILRFTGPWTSPKVTNYFLGLSNTCSLQLPSIAAGSRILVDLNSGFAVTTTNDSWIMSGTNVTSSLIPAGPGSGSKIFRVDQNRNVATTSIFDSIFTVYLTLAGTDANSRFEYQGRRNLL